MKQVHQISRLKRFKHFKNPKIGTVITADTIPDYHGGWTDSGWSCDQWVLWLEKVVAKYGKTIAKEMFVLHWEKQGSTDLQYNFCKYNSDFVSKVEKLLGEKVGHWFSRIFTSTTGGAADIVDNASAGAKAITSILKYAPIILLGGAAIYYRKDIKKALQK